MLTSFTLPEKEDEIRAKAAVKAQIEADKRERAAKAAREKALREGAAIPDAAPTPAAAARPAATASSDSPETRLQIRLASGGQPYKTTLSSDASTFSHLPHVVLCSQITALREVAEYLAGQVLAVDVETVTFAQHFPR